MARSKTNLVIPAGSDISDLLDGGPGTPPSSAPAMVEITLGGQKYLVPAAAAETLQKQYAEQESELGRVRGELEMARRAPAVAPAPTPTGPAAPPAAPPVDDLDGEFFASPTAAVGKALRAASDKLKAEMRQEYALEQARAKWWTDFYGAHKHLVGSETLVQAVMTAHFAELEKLPVEKQAQALADKVEAELERIIKARTGAAPPSPIDNGRPVEPGSPRTPAPAAPAQAPGRPTSIAEIQKAQRERRLAARTGRQSA